MASPSITVETVIPLSVTQRASVSALVKKKFGTSSFVANINPKILGGMRITVNSTQYDASLQGKLDQLRKTV